jgi:hypothetical protein
MDDCPNPTGPKCPRKKVLVFVEDLVRSRYSNLYVCVTSSLEQDIKRTLDLLTSTLHLVDPHEEAGQKEDIKSYIRSFVKDNQETRTWTRDDQVNMLSKRADGK